MEDYLTEKERWDWVRAQVRENAPAVLLAAVVVFGGLMGWRWWQERQDAARVLAGSHYLQMVQALESGDHTQAMTALGQLERDSAGSAYADQGKMLAARVYVEDGELDKAARELAAVAQQSKDHDLVMIARMRLARVQIAQGSADAALATLGTADAGAFAGRYHEVRGDAYFAKGDKVQALAEYRSAQTGSAGAPNPVLDLKIADLAADSPAPVVAAKPTSAPAAK
jgi:predicted negative regulator of RcsB-dependent stress response